MPDPMDDRRLALLIPVHFPAQVAAPRIAEVLQSTLGGQDRCCRPEDVLLVVDRGTPADEVIASAPEASALGRPAVHRLARNRSKTGAVLEGLRVLLDQSAAPYLMTRDCDGDHFVDDLPRFLRMADFMAARGRPFSVFGSRSSWEKPMGWLRQEWERLTNAVFIDCASFLLARRGRALDRRFWNGCPLDLQCGFRLYDRAAAEIAIAGLQRLPDDRNIYMMACEMTPFVDLTLEGGLVAQVRTLTRVTQPFSSYEGISFSETYGSLLAHLARAHEIPADALRTIVDSILVESPLFLSGHREEALRFRAIACPDAGPVDTSPFL